MEQLEKVVGVCPEGFVVKVKESNKRKIMSFNVLYKKDPDLISRYIADHFEPDVPVVGQDGEQQLVAPSLLEAFNVLRKYLKYYPYCQSAPILVVPRPKLLPGYFVPVLPFSPGMWAAILLSILGISICICCLSAALHHLLPGFTKERISLGRSFLDALAMLVLQVPNEGNEESHYSPWKHFMTWLFVYFLLITTVYSGGLASILTLPRYERPINTLVDMATSSFIWMFTHIGVTWAFKDSEDPVLRTIADKYVTASDEELADIALTGEVAVHIEELSSGVFSYGSYITIEAMSKLRLMKEPILIAHVVLIGRKGAPYMLPLNNLILALNQGGIGTYWQADVVRNFMSSRLQLQIVLSRSQNDPDGDTPRTLQLSHVQGAFMLLGLGFIIAAVVFVIELRIHRYRKRHHP